MKTKNTYSVHRDADSRAAENDIAAYYASKIYKLTEDEAKERIESFLSGHPIYGEGLSWSDIPFRAIFEPKRYFYCLKCRHCHDKRSRISYEHIKYEWIDPDHPELDKLNLPHWGTARIKELYEGRSRE